MTHPTSQKPQSTYYSVIQQYRYLIEEVKQNPNKMDYLENPKILGLSVYENQEMSLNEIAFNFYPGLLVNNIDDLIELRSQELLNQFEFVIFVAPYNPEQLKKPTQLKISLINRYIPELNVTICYLDLGDSTNKSIINFPNCYNNLGQANQLTQYLFKKIELSKYYFLIRQKSIPKVLTGIITSGIWLPIVYIPAPFIIFFVVIFIEDLLKKVSASINSALLILLLVTAPLLLYIYFVWQFDDLLKISNNKLSVRSGILKYTTIPLDKILNIEVQNQDPTRNLDSYNLKLSYYEVKNKSIKEVIINPQWSKFNTTYILTGLNAICFNYDKIYQ